MDEINGSQTTAMRRYRRSSALRSTTPCTRMGRFDTATDRSWEDSARRFVPRLLEDVVHRLQQGIIDILEPWFAALRRS